MNLVRGVSLALAAGTVLLLIVDRRALQDGLPWVVRAGLAFASVGTIGALAHGGGISTHSALLRFVAVPRIAWPAILFGVLCMLFGERVFS